jgi:hypothetical protein
VVSNKKALFQRLFCGDLSAQRAEPADRDGFTFPEKRMGL